MTVRDYNRIVNGYGEPISQSLTVNQRDYVSLNFTKTVLGVILSVNPSDSDRNRSAYQSEDRRGYFHTCTVLVIEDGRSSLFTLNNVIITPDSRTGLNDYYERLPNGCSALINGQPWNNEVNNIDPFKLDGDWCIVGFLGGSLDTPYILRWWPHPGNRSDAATSGQSNPNDRVRRPYLVQDGRFFHRINGVEFVISKQGHVYLSTYRANSTLSFGTPLQPQDGRFPRTLNEEEGGSFKAWIKPSQSFELDWNVPTNGLGVLDEADPDLPQTNPARVGVAQAKENTYLIADQTRFELDVPELFKVQSKQRILLTSEEDTTLTVGTDLSADVGGNATISANGNVKINTPRFEVSLNETAGILAVTNNITGDGLSINSNTNTVSLTATTAMNITAIGLINITGAPGQVVIQGRVVRPIPDPI